MRVPKVSALIAKIKIWSKDKAHVRAALLLLACIIVAIVALIVSQPEMRAGDYTISKRAYKEYVEQAAASGISEADARTALYDSLVSRAAVKKAGFSPDLSDAELVAAASLKYKLADDVEPTAYQRYVAYPAAVAPKLQLADKGGYELAIINFPFSRYITGFANTKFGDPSLKGNMQAINEDKAYAKAAAEEAAAAINAGKQTAAQAVENARKDQRLVYGQASNQSRIVRVSNNQGEESIYETDFIRPVNFERITRAAAQQGKAIVEEDLFDATPGDYGLTMPDILRSDGTRMQVGYTVLVVGKSIDQKKGLLDAYNKYLGELRK